MSPTDESNEISFTTLKTSVHYNRHLLEAAEAQYVADLAKSESELLMLVREGVGVGDHSQMVNDVIKAINNYSDAVSRLETVALLLEELELEHPETL